MGSEMPLDKARLLSVILEAILYGFSLMMFGWTMWTLWSRQVARRANYKMCLVACVLFVVSTMHLVIDIVMIMIALISYRDKPGGPIGYFLDMSQWTAHCKLILFTIQTLVGDSVLLYRCYMTWKSKVVMILPVLLWCAIAVIGIITPFIQTYIAELVLAYFALTLASNILTTLLLTYRIWYIDHTAAKLLEYRTSTLRPVLHIIIDSAVLYTCTVLSGMICFLLNSNGQDVVIDMVPPIISISFYLVIIRVGIIRTRQTSDTVTIEQPLNTSTKSRSTKRNSMQVQIVTSTSMKLDDMTLAGSERNASKVTFNSDQGRTVQYSSSV